LRKIKPGIVIQILEQTCPGEIGDGVAFGIEGAIGDDMGTADGDAGGDAGAIGDRVVGGGAGAAGGRRSVRRRSVLGVETGPNGQQQQAKQTCSYIGERLDWRAIRHGF